MSRAVSSGPGMEPLHFLFIDETGVLSRDRRQPFFGLGLLRTADTAALSAELHALLQQARGRIHPRFEFKFARIGRRSAWVYRELVNLFFGVPGLGFKAQVLDKRQPGFHPGRNYGGLWEAQIAYSRRLIESALADGAYGVVIADHVTKPRESQRYFEREVRRHPRVLNALMLDSNATLYVQLADVLLGLVVYDCKVRAGVAAPNPVKQEVARHLAERVGVSELCRPHTRREPPYFAVRLVAPPGGGEK
ncbi:MAG TPA: hypothetical protein ENK20_13190 [Chromatiales bacterium]|nr:hypothetical protein [Chromatiales bacterium]